MANLFDRAGMSTATSGTGTLTLGGALGAVAPNLAGFLSFAGAGVADQNAVSYLILDVNGGWETGWGVYTASGTALTRNVTRSSNANAAISLSGNAQVFITARAEDIATVEALAAANIALNGGMEVGQESGASLLTLTNGAIRYVVDQFQAFFAAAGTLALTAQQVTPPGSPSFGSDLSSAVQIKATTGQASLGANDHILLLQPVEGHRWQRLSFGTAAAKPVTIGFWIYATIAGTLAVTVTNSAGTRAYVHNVTISNATTWEWKSFTIPGDTAGTWLTGTNVAACIAWSFGAGSSFQTAPDSWVAGASLQATSSTTNFFASAGSVVAITGVVVLPGAHQLSQEQSPLLIRPFPVEFDLCLRYYEKSYPYATAPGTPFTVGTGPLTLLLGPAAQVGGTIHHKKEKRVAPTTTGWDAAGNPGKCSLLLSGSWANNQTLSGFANDPLKFWIESTAINCTGIALEWVADARM